MNIYQKVTVISLILIITLMLLFPPFITQVPISNSFTYVNEGYSFIFSPPTSTFYKIWTAPVNTIMLITQWIGILIIGGLAFFLFRDKFFNRIKYSVVIATCPNEECKQMLRFKITEGVDTKVTCPKCKTEFVNLGT